MILANTFAESIVAAIPLVIVFGLFVAAPFARRSRGRCDLEGIAATQTEILDELRALRGRLDEVQRVLTTVE